MNNFWRKEKCGKKSISVSKDKWPKISARSSKTSTLSAPLSCRHSSRIRKNNTPKSLTKKIQKFSHWPVKSFPFKPLSRSWPAKSKSKIKNSNNSKTKSKAKIVWKTCSRHNPYEVKSTGTKKFKKIWPILEEKSCILTSSWLKDSRLRINT